MLRPRHVVVPLVTIGERDEEGVAAPGEARGEAHQVRIALRGQGRGARVRGWKGGRVWVGVWVRARNEARVGV